MPKILIVYGTTEGQTRKIAEHMAAALRHKHHEVWLYDCERRPRDLAVGEFDAVIVAGSVHQREHQERVVDFAQAHRDLLNTMPTLFTSVSLSAAFDDGKADAQSYVDTFLADTGWRPSRTIMAAGALRYSEYDYFKQQVIEHVVLRGHEVEGPGRDYELTDWPALDRDLDAFSDSLAG